MRQSHRIILNATVSYVVLVIDVALRLFMVPFVLNRIGKESYAVVVLALSVDSFVNLMRVGTAAATTKHVAAILEQKGEDRTSEFMSTSVGYGFVTGVIALVICLTVATMPERIVNLPAGLYGQLSVGLVIVGIAAFIRFTCMSFHGFLGAHQRYDLVQGVYLLWRLVSTGGIILAFLFWKASPTVYLGIYCSEAVLTNAAYLVLGHRLHRGLRLRLWLVRRWAIKALLGFSVFILLSQTIFSTYMEGSKWAIANFLSTAEVTYYAIVLMVSSQASRLLMTGVRVLIPVMSKYQALEDDRTLRETLRRGTRMGSLLTSLIVVGLVPVIGPFLSLWLGSDYVWLRPHMVAVLLCGLIYLPAACPGQGLIGLGRVGLVAVFRGIAAASGITILVLGLAVFHWGFVSLTVALCTASLVQGITNYIAGIRLTKQRGWPFVRSALLRPLAVCTPVLAVAWYVASRLVLESWPSVIGFAVAACGVLAAANALTLPAEDRELASQIWLAMRRRLGLS